MKVSQILSAKGDAVYSVKPSETVAEVVNSLHEKQVGALLVLNDGGDIAGIVSERDVVRELAKRGVGLMSQPVADIMTKNVFTCDRDCLLDDLMRDMTDRRIRHLPVVDGGKLTGMVSIGDVVKFRVDELEAESTQLREYIERG